MTKHLQLRFVLSCLLRTAGFILNTLRMGTYIHTAGDDVLQNTREQTNSIHRLAQLVWTKALQNSNLRLAQWRLPNVRSGTARTKGAHSSEDSALVITNSMSLASCNLNLIELMMFSIRYAVRKNYVKACVRCGNLPQTSGNMCITCQRFQSATRLSELHYKDPKYQSGK